MTSRRRTALVATALGGLVLTGCQFASGGTSTFCDDFTCGGEVHLQAVEAANGQTGGTVELRLYQRVFGVPVPIFTANELIGDVTCFAQEGSLATVVFEVDPSRSSVTFGSPAPAYAVTVRDGGPGPMLDGWRFEEVHGDTTVCGPPDASAGFAPAQTGDGFLVGEGLAPGES